MVKLFLDDLRTPPPGWTLCRTLEEMFAELIEPTEVVTAISLDHDLGNSDCNRTGYNIVRWIEGRVATQTYPYDGSYPVPELLIHSANPVGENNMRRGIESIHRFLDEQGILHEPTEAAEEIRNYHHGILLAAMEADLAIRRLLGETVAVTDDLPVPEPVC